LAQPEFAARYGLSVSTLRDWEQGRTVPDGPAQVLLRVIDAAPEVVERVVARG
jgi:putative transcriptional regulator